MTSAATDLSASLPAVRRSAPLRQGRRFGRLLVSGAGQGIPRLVMPVAPVPPGPPGSPAPPVLDGAGRPVRLDRAVRVAESNPAYADMAARHNLPQHLTSFVGRQREIETTARLLESTRLLTLTGPGGVGKTRLGHAVAAHLLERDATSKLALVDGVWLVELAALADPLLVEPAVADAVGVRQEAGRPPTAGLADALRPKRLLLVLDNCEHLVEACAVLAETLLRACPGLRILATSRQRLGIAGETTMAVPTLSMTPTDMANVLTGNAADGDAPDDRSIGMSRTAALPEAVQLFLERARSIRPSLSLTDGDLATVHQICERLDGIPLAIELAAARIAVLGPEQIAARLDDRFRLLTGGSRTSLPRYRTLRALIDWSHDLLVESERVLLRRLAVFAGGWTLDAAEAVCAGDGLDACEILDLMTGLVTKSLVQVDERGAEVRYRFLETIREYADARLGDAGEAVPVRERHRNWVVALAEEAEPALVGAAQDVWLNRLDRERENIRTAQRRAVAHGDADTMVRLGASLWRFWFERADAADARELVDATVLLADRMPPIPALARALQGVGMLAGLVADYPTCRALLDKGLIVARQIEDRRVLATLLDALGRQAFVEAHYSEARVLLTEGLDILREVGSHHDLARCLSHLGFLEYLEGRLTLASTIYREGLTHAQAAADTSTIAEFLDNLGRTAQAEGDLASAVRDYQEAVAIWRNAGQGNWLAMGLNNLGGAEALCGNVGVARGHLEEALRLASRSGNRRRQAFTLAAVAALAAVEGEHERGVRLDATANAVVSALGATLVQPAYALYLPHVERARLALGTVAAAEASAAGVATTLADAVADALVWLAEPTPAHEIALAVAGVISATDEEVQPPAASSVPTPHDTGGLSRREVEVAALVAHGMTNRQIAEQLVISEGTAATHVKHILARLTLDSRVQVATWAVAHGLHEVAVRSVSPSTG